MNFFISYRNYDGELVLNHGKIMRKYACGWFMINWGECVLAVVGVAGTLGSHGGAWELMRNALLGMCS